MNKQLNDFLNDLVIIIQEKYDETLNSPLNENAEDKLYRLGSNFGYYDVLDLIKSQVLAYGYDPSNLGEISPVIGQKIQDTHE